MPDLDALAAMHCLLAWCDFRLALLLGGHWTTALQMLQVVVKGSGAEGASTFLFIRCCKQADSCCLSFQLLSRELVGLVVKFWLASRLDVPSSTST